VRVNSIANESINLSGVLLPITTPFTRTEAIDVAGLTANLERWNATGVTGYVVLGSTGERVNLDEREYLQVIPRMLSSNTTPAWLITQGRR
jgi:dihydrodipicolinate synthase/N-acetylneuraminate lyase